MKESSSIKRHTERSIDNSVVDSDIVQNLVCVVEDEAVFNPPVEVAMSNALGPHERKSVQLPVGHGSCSESRLFSDESINAITCESDAWTISRTSGSLMEPKYVPADRALSSHNVVSLLPGSEAISSAHSALNSSDMSTAINASSAKISALKIMRRDQDTLIDRECNGAFVEGLSPTSRHVIDKKLCMSARWLENSLDEHLGSNLIVLDAAGKAIAINEPAPSRMRSITPRRNRPRPPLLGYFRTGSWASLEDYGGYSSGESSGRPVVTRKKETDRKRKEQRCCHQCSVIGSTNSPRQTLRKSQQIRTQRAGIATICQNHIAYYNDNLDIKVSGERNKYCSRTYSRHCDENSPALSRSLSTLPVSYDTHGNVQSLVPKSNRRYSSSSLSTPRTGSRFVMESFKEHIANHNSDLGSGNEINQQSPTFFICHHCGHEHQSRGHEPRRADNHVGRQQAPQVVGAGYLDHSDVCYQDHTCQRSPVLDLRYYYLPMDSHAEYQDARLSQTNKTISFKTLNGVPPRQTRVTFSTLQIRTYERILGDNPSCSAGPSVSIGWRYDESNVTVLSLDIYEYQKGDNRYGHVTILDREEREDLLLSIGYSRAGIADAVRQNVKAKRRRRQTVNNLPVQGFEETIESIHRQIRRFVLGKRSSKFIYSEWKKATEGMDYTSDCFSNTMKRGRRKKKDAATNESSNT